MAGHGDVTEISVAHPTLGSRTFFPQAGEGNTFFPGGIVIADDQNSITTSGELILTRNRKGGMFSVLIEDDQNIREDSLFIKQLAGSSDNGDWTLSLINGAIYQCSGVPVGDYETEINAGTMTLKVVSGQFKKIQ